jgi:hypothetical protein
LHNTDLINGVSEKCQKMEKFDKIKEDITDQLNQVKYAGDLSDIGNEVGIAIAKYIDRDNTIEDFIHGLRHGVSLVDGTHG